MSSVPQRLRAWHLPDCRAQFNRRATSLLAVGGGSRASPPYARLMATRVIHAALTVPAQPEQHRAVQAGDTFNCLAAPATAPALAWLCGGIGSRPRSAFEQVRRSANSAYA